MSLILALKIDWNGKRDFIGIVDTQISCRTGPVWIPLCITCQQIAVDANEKVSEENTFAGESTDDDL